MKKPNEEWIERQSINIYNEMTTTVSSKKAYSTLRTPTKTSQPTTIVIPDSSTRPSLLQNDPRLEAEDEIPSLLKAVVKEAVRSLKAGKSWAVESGGETTTAIEYLATSPDLADRRQFPNVYRLTAPERVGSAVVQLLRTFNWTRIGIIQQAEEHLTQKNQTLAQNYNDLRKELELTNVAVIAHIPTSEDSTRLLENMMALKNMDARIIVVTAFQSTTMKIICNAKKLEIYGKQFVWIFTENYPHEFWKNGGVNCTEKEMQKVVEGAFFIHTLKRNRFEEIGKANITYSDLINDICTRAKVSKSRAFDFAVDKCYDHVWVAALALECYLKDYDEYILNLTRRVQNGTHFSWATDADWYARSYWGGWWSPRNSKDDVYADILSDKQLHWIGRTMNITACIDKVDFLGTSGRIKFDEGAVNPVIELQRIQDARSKVVAYLMRDNRSNPSYEWINGSLIWKDNSIPHDSAITIPKEKPIPKSLSKTMCGLAGVGIIFTIACFSFNVVWRKHRIVKMSSPNINSIALVGCLLLYVTIVMKTTETITKTICAVQLFCFWIGFTTTFGSMLLKTWRVYRIFTNKNMKQKMHIRDKHLLVMIGILVSMEILVLIVWISYAPQQVEEQQLKTENVTTDSGDKVVAFHRVCASFNSDYFNWTLQIMNGALIAFGAFLAWETRRVHIDALNDSKTIGICLYNVVVLSVVHLCLSLILKDKPIELLGVTSVCLFVGTLVSEMLIFLPKMLAVYRKSIATPHTLNLESSTPSNVTPNLIELSTIRSCDRATQTELTTKMD